MKISYFIYFFSQTVHKTYLDIMFFSPKISFEASNRVFWLQTKISSFIQILSLKHIGRLLGRSPQPSASPFAHLNTHSDPLRQTPNHARQFTGFFFFLFCTLTRFLIQGPVECLQYYSWKGKEKNIERDLCRPSKTLMGV